MTANIASVKTVRRIDREKKTMAAMIRLYCRKHHQSKDSLCPECQELHDYAICRLDRCPFGGEKPTCAQCPIHCYQRPMRERVHQVMRFAGPRMLFRHPLLAIYHLLDGRRRADQSRR